MLRQDINLYQPPPLELAFLTWQRLCFSYVLLTVIMMFMYISSLWHIHELHVQADESAKQVGLLQNKFYRFKNTFPPVLFSKDATHSVNELETELQNQQQILKTIVGKTPFSVNLSILAQIIVPNVWLTEISIVNSGAEIDLKGRSLSMDDLQKFITNISHEKTFADYSLIMKDMENNRNTDKTHSLAFEISIMKKQHEH